MKKLRRLEGVYDADGTIRGELSYWVLARLGRAHCSLCDVTHGLFRERSDWRSARDALGIPFATWHRDDQPDAVRAALGAGIPGVAAVFVDDDSAQDDSAHDAADDEHTVLLLGPAEIEACQGAPEKLVDAIRLALKAF